MYFNSVGTFFYSSGGLPPLDNGGIGGVSDNGCNEGIVELGASEVAHSNGQGGHRPLAREDNEMVHFTLGGVGIGSQCARECYPQQSG